MGITSGNATPQRVVVNLSHASLAAQFSEQMAIAVIPIVAVVALGATAQQSASLQAINTLPFLLLSLPAGLVADRGRRKPLMIATELLRAAALFVLFALFHARVLSLYTLGSLGVAIATGTVVFSVSAPSLVAAMVETGDLLAANRRLEIARSIAYTAGPSVGGIFAGWASGVFAFLAAFALSLASAWFLARLPAEAPRPRSRRALARELFDGVQFIVTPRELIARVSSVIMMATFGARPLGALLGAFLSTRLGMTSCLVGAACGFAVQLAIIVFSAPARLRSIEGLEAARAEPRNAKAMRFAAENPQE
ncbi:MFS transporter [Paraburkholderia sp. CNPSo 3274]|uniref:MFS transporter n=1 Tax=Paraburkholderia sp. CNPSo 3274 TaxID=2940932 RepID=UPI0020B90244|nr:MFS transporter [Paraburkholderia sp. CNPSo 3274]MCP3706302.1 MFS transporter [Paraburkholderia sp. CNPSo 3274]